MTAAGNLEYLGRSDDQVKLRGVRLELGEVEEALKRCEGVTAAAAKLVDSPTGAILVGYIVVTPGCLLDARRARAELRERLPDVMVPARVVQIDELPITLSGKLDRARLPAPREPVANDRRPETPGDSVTAQVLRIFVEVGLEGIGADDDFFEAGGHSLMAIRVMAHLRERLGVTLPLEHLWSTPTARTLGDVVRKNAAPTP